MHHEWRRGGYVVSTDPERLDLQVIHAFLTASYWAAGIPLDVVRRSLEHSVSFGLYREQAAAAAGGARETRRDAAPDAERARGEQVGFARVITDRATFGYLGDVFVLPAIETFSVLATNQLGGICLATPAISEGTLFFRTTEKLLAIGAKQ